MSLILDKYNRTFKTLRISLLNACNMGCVYCVDPDTKAEAVDKDSALSLDRLVHTIDELRKALPLESIRLTGGEPTLYKDLVPLIKGISRLGVPHIKMTSNGYLLSGMAEELYDSGLKEVNISLDAIEEKVFFDVTRRRDLYRVLEAIDACLGVGMKVKLNTVVLKGINDSQILPLLRYSFEKNISIRFLELMKMGHIFSKDFDSYFYSEQNILDTIAQELEFSSEERIEGATANYWRTTDGQRFGIIANESSPFCRDCNRLRLDSYGNVYGCLSENIPVPVSDVLEDQKELMNRLNKALSQKQAVKFKGSELTMISIGG